MDNKVGYVTIVLLAITLGAVTVAFVFLQSEINSLTIPAVTPTPASGNVNPPSQTPSYTSQTPPLSPLSHSYVVYEWYLKPEYINNMTWLDQRTSEVGPVYNNSLTWKQNYVLYLSSPIAYPEQAKDDPLVWHLLGRNVFISAEFNDQTGYTKAVYDYAEYQGVTMLYGIEAFLPQMAVNGNWTRAYL